MVDRVGYMREYRQNEKYKARIKEYRQSEKYKASQKKYYQSDKYKAAQKKYRQSEKFKASQKKYQQSEKHKVRIKEYHQSDKYKVSLKKYRQSDKYKAYRKRVAARWWLHAVEDFYAHWNSNAGWRAEGLEKMAEMYSKNVCNLSGQQQCKVQEEIMLAEKRGGGKLW